MLLELRELHAYYGASHVLQGISLSMDHGEIVALLGRNGMGKSTTLKSIVGFVKPKSGTVQYKGTDVTAFAPYKVARAGIGYVPEERRIFPNLTVFENLAMGIKGRKIENTDDPGTWTVEKIFHHFPVLRSRKGNKGNKLSGGEQQMLTIARTLMGNPDLILVDEPTEGLAPLMVREVRDVIKEINRVGVSVLLVEHNFKVAMSLVNRFYLMGKGHIGFSGNIQDLDEHPEIKAKYLEV